jgi:hypothetical protein
VTSGGLAQDLRAIKVVMAREWIRFRQDKIRIVSALVQPVLFIFVLGTGLSSITGTSSRASTSAPSCSPGCSPPRCCSPRCSRRCRSCGTASSGSCARCSWRRCVEAPSSSARRSAARWSPRSRACSCCASAARRRALHPVMISPWAGPDLPAVVHAVRHGPGDRGSDPADADDDGDHADGAAAAVVPVGRALPHQQPAGLAAHAGDPQPGDLRGARRAHDGVLATSTSPTKPPRPR